MHACTGLAIWIVPWSRRQSPVGERWHQCEPGQQACRSPYLSWRLVGVRTQRRRPAPAHTIFYSGGNHSSCILDGTSEHTSEHCTNAGAGVYSPAPCGSSGDVLCSPSRGAPNSAGASSTSHGAPNGAGASSPSHGAPTGAVACSLSRGAPTGVSDASGVTNGTFLDRSEVLLRTATRAWIEKRTMICAR